jgi:hypothetical protein
MAAAFEITAIRFTTQSGPLIYSPGNADPDGYFERFDDGFTYYIHGGFAAQATGQTQVDIFVDDYKDWLTANDPCVTPDQINSCVGIYNQETNTVYLSLAKSENTPIHSITYNKTGGSSQVLFSANGTPCAECDGDFPVTIINSGGTLFASVDDMAGDCGSIVTWSWNTGEFGSSITPTSDGTYTVTVGCSNGCSASASIVVQLTESRDYNVKLWHPRGLLGNNITLSSIKDYQGNELLDSSYVLDTVSGSDPGNTAPTVITGLITDIEEESQVISTVLMVANSGIGGINLNFDGVETLSGQGLFTYTLEETGNPSNSLTSTFHNWNPNHRLRCNYDLPITTGTNKRLCRIYGGLNILGEDFAPIIDSRFDSGGSPQDPFVNGYNMLFSSERTRLENDLSAALNNNYGGDNDIDFDSILVLGGPGNSANLQVANCNMPIVYAVYVDNTGTDVETQVFSHSLCAFI